MKYFQKQTKSPVPYFEEALKKNLIWMKNNHICKTKRICLFLKYLFFEKHELFFMAYLYHLWCLIQSAFYVMFFCRSITIQYKTFLSDTLTKNIGFKRNEKLLHKNGGGEMTKNYLKFL